MFVARAVGWSMAPIINPNDQLFISKVGHHAFKVGDIVVYLQRGALISHRIIRISFHGIYLKGDNSFQFDTVIRPESILGKVVKVRGKYGCYRLTGFLSSVIAYYYVIFSVILYIMPYKYFLRNYYPGRRVLLFLLK